VKYDDDSFTFRSKNNINKFSIYSKWAPVVALSDSNVLVVF
jgi:hypothetical protein